MSSVRSRRGRLVAGLGAIFAAVPSLLAVSGALGIQIIAATAGAVLATGGAAMLRVAWPLRRRSDLHHLLAAAGFFLLCLGSVAMLAGVGLYH